jgi:hypothetical protein
MMFAAAFRPQTTYRYRGLKTSRPQDLKPHIDIGVSRPLDLKTSDLSRPQTTYRYRYVVESNVHQGLGFRV